MPDESPALGPPWLDDTLRRGEVVVIDGATGSELQRRAVPMHGQAWSAAAVLTHPHVLQAVHEDYLRAGARVLIANTFAASRQVLEPAGLGDEVARINRAAVDIARRACDAQARAPVAVAGSISDFRPAADRERWESARVLAATYREQAQGLAEAGVDLLALEMMQEPEIAVPAIEAALATGLPVWVGLSCRVRDHDHRLVLYDDPSRDFDECLDAVLGLGAGLFTIMHSSVADTGPGLAALRARWSGPLGAYPNRGFFRMPNWQFEDAMTPEEFAAAALGWAADGVQVIGGCCGIGPPHIAALHARLGARPAPAR